MKGVVDWARDLKCQQMNSEASAAQTKDAAGDAGDAGGGGTAAGHCLVRSTTESGTKRGKARKVCILRVPKGSQQSDGEDIRQKAGRESV